MPRRVLEGEVVSNKTDKTITVLVERRFMHPVYKKYVRRTDKYAAHDADNQFNVGDSVQIVECRPISKTKKWTVMTGDETAKVSAKNEKEAVKAAPKKAAASKASKSKDKKGA